MQRGVVADRLVGLLEQVRDVDAPRAGASSTASRSSGTSSGGSVDVNSEPGPSTSRSASRTARRRRAGCAGGPGGSRRRRRTWLRSLATAVSPATTRPSSISATSAAGVGRGGQHLAGDGEHARAERDRGLERADDLGQRGQEQVAERVAGQLAARRSGAGRPWPAATRPRPAPRGSCGCRRAAACRARAAGGRTSRRRRSA